MTDIAILKEQLINIRTDLLFKTNQSGELLQINEVVSNEGERAPLLYACVTENGFNISKRFDVSDDWLARIRPLIAQAFSDIHFGSITLQDTISTFSKSLGENLCVKCCLAFYIPPLTSDGSNEIEISDVNKSYLETHFPYTYSNLDDHTPCFVKLVNKEAVAICRTVRRHPLALECGVDTLAEVRGQGFGTQVVRSWANRVWTMNRIPCYSVEITNEFSLAITSRIGMIQYAIDISIIRRVG